MDETVENNQDQVLESNQLRSAFEVEAIGMRCHDNSILTWHSFIRVTMILIMMDGRIYILIYLENGFTVVVNLSQIVFLNK